MIGNHPGLRIRNAAMGQLDMLIGDLDIERAETDSAYLTQVRQFLISTLDRKPQKRKTPARQRKYRRSPHRREPSKALAALAGPRALG